MRSDDLEPSAFDATEYTTKPDRNESTNPNEETRPRQYSGDPFTDRYTTYSDAPTTDGHDTTNEPPSTTTEHDTGGFGAASTGRAPSSEVTESNTVTTSSRTANRGLIVGRATTCRQ